MNFLPFAGGRRGKLAGIGTLALVAAAFTAGSARAEEWTKSYTVSGRAHVRVDSNDGSVRVTTGDSVRAALAHLIEPGRHFDVLVTDIGMPDEDGYSLVRKLRKLSAGENLVAIAVTGYASQGDIEAAIDAGFDLHVPKPVDFDSFVPIIRRMATRHN